MINFSQEEQSDSKHETMPLTDGSSSLTSLQELQHQLMLMQNLLNKLLTSGVHDDNIKNNFEDIKENIDHIIQLINTQQNTEEPVAGGTHLQVDQKITFLPGDNLPLETDLFESPNESLEKGKEKILIIDDDYEIRQFIKNVLNEQYSITECSNGNEGYEKILDSMPDLIISDVVMPGMNGVELCKKIKADVRTSHIPFILLTARTAVPYRLEGLEAGADTYINKPFNILELLLRVRNLLETLQNQRKKYAQDIFQTPKQVTTNSTDEVFLHRVIKYVEDNIDDSSLDISALASELNMSSSNLYRKVKSITGMSSIDFVINHKMKFAAHLLLSGSYSVKEVAYKVGFTDARYFSTRFKKYFKFTPTEYYERTVEKMKVDASL